MRDEFLDCGGTLRDDEFRIIIVRSLANHSVWQREMSLGNFARDSEDYMSQLCLLEAQGLGGARKNEGALHTKPGQSRRVQKTSKERPTCPNCRKVGHTLESCWAPGGGAVAKRPPGYKIPADLVAKERANLLAQIAELDREHDNSALEAKIEEVDIPDSPTPERAQLARTSLDFALLSGKNLALNRTCWLLDSGASSHMTNDRNNFKTYETIQPLIILTAKEGVSLLAVGRGTIVVHFSVGRKIF